MIQLIEWENQDEFIPNFPKDFKREILIEKTFNSFCNKASIKANTKKIKDICDLLIKSIQEK